MSGEINPKEPKSCTESVHEAENTAAELWRQILGIYSDSGCMEARYSDRQAHANQS